MENLKDSSRKYRLETLNEAWEIYGSARQIRLAVENGELQFLDRGNAVNSSQALVVSAWDDRQAKLVWRVMNPRPACQCRQALEDMGRKVHIYEPKRALELFPQIMRQELHKAKQLARNGFFASLDLQSVDVWLPVEDLAGLLLRNLADLAIFGRADDDQLDRACALFGAFESAYSQKLSGFEQEPFGVFKDAEGLLVEQFRSTRTLPCVHDLVVVTRIMEGGRFFQVVHQDDMEDFQAACNKAAGGEVKLFLTSPVLAILRQHYYWEGRLAIIARRQEEEVLSAQKLWAEECASRRGKMPRRGGNKGLL